jgi:hypothetical protein
MARPRIDDELETLRQLVISARHTPDVEQPAEESIRCLRDLYTQRRSEFTSEDIRWINVLKGFLRKRLDAHRRLRSIQRNFSRRQGEIGGAVEMRHTGQGFDQP